MRAKEVQPVIHSLIVVVEGLKYKDQICSIDVVCLPSSREDKKIPKFTPISVSCKEPYFTMGQSFWKENFGTRQENRIKKLCDEATKKFVEEYDDKDEEIVKELHDILVRCETSKEYHQAIVELKIRIKEGL